MSDSCSKSSFRCNNFVTEAMGCGASAGPRGEGAQCGAKEEVFAISPSTRVFLENVSGYVASVLAALNIFFLVTGSFALATL